MFVIAGVTGRSVVSSVWLQLQIVLIVLQAIRTNVPLRCLINAMVSMKCCRFLLRVTLSKRCVTRCETFCVSPNSYFLKKV